MRAHAAKLIENKHIQSQNAIKTMDLRLITTGGGDGGGSDGKPICSHSNTFLCKSSHVSSICLC